MAIENQKCDPTLTSRTPNTHWGIRVSNDEEGSRKSLACRWIEVIRAKPALADKIRHDRLLEADLFEVQRELKGIVATTTRKILPYRSPAQV